MTNDHIRLPVLTAELQDSFSVIAKSSPTLTRFVEDDVDFISQGEIMSVSWSAKYAVALLEIGDNVTNVELEIFFSTVEKIVANTTQETANIWQVGFLESLINLSDTHSSLFRYIRMLGPECMNFANTWGVNWDKETNKKDSDDPVEGEVIDENEDK